MPVASEWETEYLTWQHKMHSREKKELPEEFIKEKMVIEQEGGEGGVGRWQPAPRETEADIAMDTKSLRRKLDQRLFLLVKQKGKPPTPQPRNQAEVNLAHGCVLFVPVLVTLHVSALPAE